ncbi:hypothetical protein EC988_004646, partial [Linderina pennispora]
MAAYAENYTTSPTLNMQHSANAADHVQKPQATGGAYYPDPNNLGGGGGTAVAASWPAESHAYSTAAQPIGASYMSGPASYPNDDATKQQQQQYQYSHPQQPADTAASSPPDTPLVKVMQQQQQQQAQQQQQNDPSHAGVLNGIGADAAAMGAQPTPPLSAASHGFAQTNDGWRTYAAYQQASAIPVPGAAAVGYSTANFTSPISAGMGATGLEGGDSAFGAANPAAEYYYNQHSTAATSGAPAPHHHQQQQQQQQPNGLADMHAAHPYQTSHPQQQPQHAAQQN